MWGSDDQIDLSGAQPVPQAVCEGCGDPVYLPADVDPADALQTMRCSACGGLLEKDV
jgi:hypothetical protein